MTQQLQVFQGFIKYSPKDFNISIFRDIAFTSFITSIINILLILKANKINGKNHV